VQLDSDEQEEPKMFKSKRNQGYYNVWFTTKLRVWTP
jgi:hypothetical protein